jgi:hypothetical protein
MPFNEMIGVAVVLILIFEFLLLSCNKYEFYMGLEESISVITAVWQVWMGLALSHLNV